MILIIKQINESKQKKLLIWQLNKFLLYETFFLLAVKCTCWDNNIHKSTQTCFQNVQIAASDKKARKVASNKVLFWHDFHDSSYCITPHVFLSFEQNYFICFSKCYLFTYRQTQVLKLFTCSTEKLYNFFFSDPVFSWT